MHNSTFINFYVIIFLYRHQDERKEFLVSVSDGAESIFGSTSSCPSVCVCVHIHSNDHDWSRSHSHSSMFSFKDFPWLFPPPPPPPPNPLRQSLGRAFSASGFRSTFLSFFFSLFFSPSLVIF